MSGHRSRLFKAGGFAAALPLLVGCAVGPNHEAPKVATPQVHRGEKTAAKKSFAELPWWELYRDPKLFELIKTATTSAYDLRIALSRVEIARQSHRAAAWALAPTVGVSLGAGDAVGSTSIPGYYPPTNTNQHYGLSVGASWEPDLWGRLRRIKEAAENEYLAADEDRRGVYIALVSDIAELYFDLAAIDKQEDYANQAVQTRRETLDMFQQRAGGGVGNDLEVARAKASLKQAEAQVTQLKLARITDEDALSYLLARPPGAIEGRASLDMLAIPPDVPAGLPSTLLKRRPDIRGSEKRLKAANARIGAEMADFFPSFNLTGFLGLASPNLNEAKSIRGGAALFKWTLPFLGGERERAEYDAAKAAWEGSAADYERTVTNAFREVADSLGAVQTLRERRAAVQEQVEALEYAGRIAVDRYRGGVSNYLEVLTVQEQMLAAQLELGFVIGRQLVAVSQLYRNLGGGWPIPEEKDDENKDEQSSK